MSSRAERLNAQMRREFEGTFVPENRSEPHCFGSTEFTPEIAEEEERVVRGDRLHRYVPQDQIVDPRTEILAYREK